MPAPTASAAATTVIHSGYFQAAAAALLAALAITAAAGFLARKRLAWETRLDMPVGVTTPQAAGTGTPARLLLGEPGLRYHVPHADSTEQGWLVLLGITNPGCSCIRSRDLGVPLTFAFPGRQIHAARILPEAATLTTRRAARAPTIRLLPENCLEPGHAARMYLTGEYELRPNDSYTIMLVLSGTPAAHPHRIRQEGSLASGKIIPGLESR
jgi:hypothetical protein